MLTQLVALDQRNESVQRRLAATDERGAAIAIAAANPVAHLVANIVFGEVTSGKVDVISKGLGLLASGAIGSVVYRDRDVQPEEGLRIARREVIARRTRRSPTT